MLCELLDTLCVVSTLANILIHYLIASLANQLPVSVYHTGPGTCGQVVSSIVTLTPLSVHNG